jgi:short subunit dehydrogenase-like uncharacterized protein
LVRRGAKPLLAGRNRHTLETLADELGGLDIAVADVSSPASIRELLGSGDALVTTVGPFSKLGAPAFEASLSSGAHYVDSTGEPAWIRHVFESDSRCAEAGIAALTAFGYDYVPGNLAAGLALERAGSEARTVDVGYFVQGGFGASGGTMASLAGAMLSPGFEFADGEIKTARGAKTDHTFQTSIGPRTGMSIGASEHFAVPRIADGVRDVNTYLGWFGGNTTPIKIGSAALSGVTRIPGVKPVIEFGLSKALPGSTGGPSASERSKTSSVAVAEARDQNGNALSQVEVNGPNAYDMTASFLAWAGIKLAADGPAKVGSLGPVEAFGLEELVAGCASAGLEAIN